MRTFAKDQSKNPPPTNWLDQLLRRFARIAYGLAVLLMYTLASTALGLALAPSLWIWSQIRIGSEQFGDVDQDGLGRRLAGQRADGLAHCGDSYERVSVSRPSRSWR